MPFTKQTPNEDPIEYELQDGDRLLLPDGRYANVEMDAEGYPIIVLEADGRLKVQTEALRTFFLRFEDSPKAGECVDMIDQNLSEKELDAHLPDLLHSMHYVLMGAEDA